MHNETAPIEFRTFRGKRTTVKLIRDFYFCGQNYKLFIHFNIHTTITEHIWELNLYVYSYYFGYLKIT